jgi:hypothetical protein
MFVCGPPDYHPGMGWFSNLGRLMGRLNRWFAPVAVAGDARGARDPHAVTAVLGEIDAHADAPSSPADDDEELPPLHLG